MNTNIRVELFEKRIKELVDQETPQLRDIIELNKTLSDLYCDCVITDIEYEKYCLYIFRLYIFNVGGV